MDFAPIVGSGLMISITFAAVGLLTATYAERRAFAIISVLALFLIPFIVVEGITEISDDAKYAAFASPVHVIALLHPGALQRGPPTIDLPGERVHSRRLRLCRSGSGIAAHATAEQRMTTPEKSHGQPGSCFPLVRQRRRRERHLVQFPAGGDGAARAERGRQIDHFAPAGRIPAALSGRSTRAGTARLGRSASLPPRGLGPGERSSVRIPQRPRIRGDQRAGCRACRIRMPPPPARIAWVGLEADQDRPMKDYSKGMRQRAKIAAALVHDSPGAHSGRAVQRHGPAAAAATHGAAARDGGGGANHHLLVAHP